MDKYVEHEKLKEAKERDATQAVFDFCQFLGTKGYTIAQWVEDGNGNEILMSFMYEQSFRKLMFEFFGIDEQKLEDEKIQMLEECRKQ